MRNSPIYPKLDDFTPVYFVQAEPDGLIKIGRSRGLNSRIEALASWSPVPLRVLLVVPGTPGDEYRLHYRFRHALRHHEWFEPVPELLAFIAEVGRTNALPPDDTPYAEIKAWRGKIASAKRGTVKWTVDDRLFLKATENAGRACFNHRTTNMARIAAVRAERARRGYSI